jgi:hypothetical protein
VEWSLAGFLIFTHTWNRSEESGQTLLSSSRKIADRPGLESWSLTMASDLCRAQCLSPVKPLMQIKKRYAVEWKNLALSIDADLDHRTIRVQSRDTGTLYKAHRSSVDAAKIAGIEFAVFYQGGETLDDSPEKLASALPWREQW